MVIKLDERHKKITMDFLEKEAALNLFIIGDIENFGFNDERVNLWGSFEKDEIKGVLLRFNKYYIPYFIEGFKDIEIFKNIINIDSDAKGISGKSELLKEFEFVFDKSEVIETFFCEIDKKVILNNSGNEIIKADNSNIEEVCNFINEIKEFQTELEVESVKKELENNSKRIYFIKNEKGEIISSAQTTAETKTAAMIVAVATKEDYRGKGIASDCISKLCLDLVNEGKKVCLFYINEIAGRIYHKVGFNTIGKWTMITKK